MKKRIIDGIEIYENEFDLEQSKEVFNTCKSFLKKQECYTNTFYVMSHYISNFEERGWRIAYGYFMTMDQLFIRHCYIIDREGKVIDPTYILTRRDDTEESPIYWTFSLFEMDDYLSLVERYDNSPDFIEHYQDTHRTLLKWGIKQEKKVVFMDY